MGEVVNASRQFRERKWCARWEQYLAGEVSSDDMIRETLAEPEFADYCKQQYAQERKRREREKDGA